MAMSDCEKCWETPCCCGWEYRDWDRNRRIDLAANVLGVEARFLEKVLGEEIPENHPDKQ